MLFYRTTLGIGRGAGEYIEILDLPFADLGALLRAGPHTLWESKIRELVPSKDVVLLPPVQSNGRLFLNGANYIEHAREGGMELPTVPLFLDISDAGLTGPYADIRLPGEAPHHVDYEVELAVVMGRAGRNISRAQVWQHVGALMVANDVSARDVQLAGMKDGRLVDLDLVRRSKSFPSFKPMGPGALIVDRDFRLGNLELSTRVNGILRQRANTSQMIHDIPSVIEHISRAFELFIGDIILTGTPAGVALATGDYLREGDVVEVSVEGIGTLRNRVVAG
jgi:2-keto-4-pentenoate hydratase/2-oxohepta-3-ene-1,7-dioic acid hydratase in catechol pathway